MSGSGQFCPRCGEDVPPGAGHQPPDLRGSTSAELCRECYIEAIDLVSVPENVTIHLCPSCGAIRQEGAWEDVGATDYTDVAIDAVADTLRVHRDAAEVSWTVEPQQRGPNELVIHLRVSAQVAGATVEASREVLVRIARDTCPPCGRKAGDYYAGTVQVRADSRIPASDETARAIDIANHIIDETDDRDAFLSEIIERPEGVDIRVSTNKLGSRIAQRITAELGGTVESSETLVTEDGDGEGVYRVAFAVRLPRFRPGDIVQQGDHPPVLVEGDVRGRELATGKEITIDANFDADRVGSADDIVETTLVTVEDAHAIQVIDPDSAAAVTIPRPHDFAEDGDTVHVVRASGQLHALPVAVVKEVRS